MGIVDTFYSRRTNFEECQYWVRNESERAGSSSEWILNHTPSGTFFAKEISVAYNQFNQLAGVFAFDKNGITIQTDDDVKDLTRGCLVLYNEQCWIVDNVQKTIHKKSSQFSRETKYTYAISLRR